MNNREQALLAHFVTNLDRNVYGLKNLPQVVMGAVFAAYSRSTLSAREILIQKFFGDAEFKRIAGAYNIPKTDDSPLADPAKAEAFYDRVLVQYGDDSVAELGITHIAVEKVSNVVAKLIEDRRIGLNPLEKSSRYVNFNQKDAHGQYAYYRPPNVMKSALGKVYAAAMDLLFDTYGALIDPLKAHFATRFPRQPDQSETAYAAAIRAQACDVARYLLPMGTLTNVGLVGNGRAFEYVIQCLLATPFLEAHVVARDLLAELRLVLPAFVRRIETERGEQSVAYLKSRSAYEHAAPQPDMPPAAMTRMGVELAHFDKDGETRVAAAMMFESSQRPLSDLHAALATEAKDYIRAIIRGALPLRGHRTHKVSRAFEHASYTFDIVCDIGAFRDLHRHRMLTQQRQTYHPNLGYVVPEDIAKIGAKDRYRQAMDSAQRAYFKLAAKFPHEAQYITPFGYLIRFNMKMNAREAYHLCELRSTIQGHWSYRYIAQEIARRIREVHPAIGQGMLVDWSENAEMTRLKAESRQESKLLALGLKRLDETPALF